MENSRRGRLFNPEKPSKSEALSDWTKFPHIDIFEASAFLDGLAPSEYVLKRTSHRRASQRRESHQRASHRTCISYKRIFLTGVDLL